MASADITAVKQVAEVVYARSCFGFRGPRNPVAVDVLTASSAAAKVHQLPLNIIVTELPDPTVTPQQEKVVARVAFADKDSLEAFTKLGLQALPEWLSIRQSVLGKNTLLVNGVWLLDNHDQALRLRWPDGAASGLLQLDPCTARIQLFIPQPAQAPRCETVSSLLEATKLIKKHTRTRLHVDGVVQQSVQGLKATTTCLDKLAQQLQASARDIKGTAHM
eukprot:gene6737-6957_t